MLLRTSRLTDVPEPMRMNARCASWPRVSTFVLGGALYASYVIRHASVTET